MRCETAMLFDRTWYDSTVPNCKVKSMDDYDTVRYGTVRYDEENGEKSGERKKGENEGG